jgi:hypothetical protein
MNFKHEMNGHLHAVDYRIYERPRIRVLSEPSNINGLTAMALATTVYAENSKAGIFQYV